MPALTAPTVTATDVVAHAVVDLLRRVDALLPDPELHTAAVERAITRAGAVLHQHAPDIGQGAHDALSVAIDAIELAMHFHLDATTQPIPVNDAAGHAARLLDALTTAGWSITRTPLTSTSTAPAAPEGI